MSYKFKMYEYEVYQKPSESKRAKFIFFPSTEFEMNSWSNDNNLFDAVINQVLCLKCEQHQPPMILNKKWRSLTLPSNTPGYCPMDLTYFDSESAIS